VALSEYGPFDMRKDIANALEPDAKAFFGGEAVAPYNLSTLYSTLIELDVAQFDEESDRKPVEQFADFLGIGNQTGFELSWRKKLEVLWQAGEPLSEKTVAELDLLQEEAWREKKREEWRALFGGEFCEAMYREVGDADDSSWHIADTRFHFRNRFSEEAWKYGYSSTARRAAWEQQAAAYEEFDTSRFGVTVGVLLDTIDQDLASLGYDEEYSIHRHLTAGGDPDQDLASLGHEGRCGFFRLMVFSELEERLLRLEMLSDIGGV